MIINEVSNGPSGAQEYVEFVVVSNTVGYDCNSLTPPCIDIRGWIFDDNSGFHGAGGVAAGAIRFSQNALWQCVPLGTIIVIYNDADVNPSITANDLSGTDGNCRIVAPISNTQLFERNGTTPGAAACSYPSTGWVAGGSWTNTALANTSDCARIVNLLGCEVFSVCYGATANTNTLIYFTGTGGGTVYSFNGNDPQLQTNWSSASAVTNQTPGAPNNAANAAYIAQFNNGCMPITPLVVTATSVNAGCVCDGSATASASGSIAGYTYEWFDENFVAIGQSTATANDLCPGNYHVIATSSIGCIDTAHITITASSSTSVSVNSVSMCTGSSVTLTATPSVAGGTFLWSPGGATTNTITVSPIVSQNYTVTYNSGGCSSTGVGSVTVNALPVITVTSTVVCAGQAATITASGADSFVWNTGATTASLTINPATTTTTFTVNGTNATTDCSNSTTGIITVNALPLITSTSATVCAGQSATIMASGADLYSWNTGVSSANLSVNPATQTTSYTVIGTNTVTGCNNSATGTIVVDDLPIVVSTSASVCEGQAATITASGADSYVWSNGAITPSITINPVIANSTYTVVGLKSTTSCTNTATGTITANSIPTINVDSQTICEGGTASLTASGATTYSWNNGMSGSTISVNPSTTTIYTVSGTSAGCIATQTVQVVVNTAPAFDFTASILGGCPPMCVDFSDLIAPGPLTITSYSWSFGSGTESDLINPTHCYTLSGLYDVGLSVTYSNNCTRSIIKEDYINVYTLPTAEFTSNVSSNPEQIDANVVFENLSANADSYFWDFGDLNFSSEFSPSHEYQQDGSYVVGLTVTSDNGCVDTISHEIVLKGMFTFYAPNSFTPNKDNSNEYFLPLGTNWDEKEYQLLIFDRWGNECFSTKDMNEGWDGKVNNSKELSQIDTYVWKVKLRDVYGNPHSFHGVVNVLR